MFFNQIADRARSDIMDALRVRQMAQPPGGFAVKPPQPQMPQDMPQATMPQPGAPQALMPPQGPQAQPGAGMPQPGMPQPPQMPAMSGLGAPYGMQTAMPMAPRPMSPQGAMRFASGGYVNMFRVR